MDISKNPNFASIRFADCLLTPLVAILRCSQKIAPYICAINTLLRSSRLREMALSGHSRTRRLCPPCHDRTYAASQFIARALSCLEL
jgi:hypothetical protein